MRKVIAALLGLALVAGFAFAQDTIRIGINLELSGRMAVTGNDTLSGAEVALSQQSEALGKKIELSVCDNASSPDGSVACANRFADEGVVAVIGSYSSSHAIPAAQILQDHGIMMVATGATNPAVTQTGDYIFRVPYSDVFEGEVTGLYAYNEVGARRAAIFNQQDDDYSTGLAGYFRDAFEAAGGSTLWLDHTANTVDFTAQINDMRAFNADFAYFPAFCAEYATLVPQLKQQGFNFQLHGGAGTDDSQCPDGGGAAFDGFTFFSFPDPTVLIGDAAQRSADFREVFLQEHDEANFTGFTLTGADAFKLIVHAIETAGSADNAAVRDAMAAIDGFPGVTGDVTYAGTDGTPADRVMGLYRYDFDADGSWHVETLRGVSRGSM